MFTIALVSVVAFNSCKPNPEQPFGVVFNVAGAGDVDGEVAFSFPNGKFDANGAASVNFKWSNDSTAVVSNEVYSLDAFDTNDAKVLAAAEVAQDYVNGVVIEALEGTYYVAADITVRETATGATFTFKKEWSNRKNETPEVVE